MDTDLSHEALKRFQDLESRVDGLESKGEKGEHTEEEEAPEGYPSQEGQEEQEGTTEESPGEEPATTGRRGRRTVSEEGL